MFPRPALATLLWLLLSASARPGSLRLTRTARLRDPSKKRSQGGEAHELHSGAKGQDKGGEGCGNQQQRGGHGEQHGACRGGGLRVPATAGPAQIPPPWGCWHQGGDREQRVTAWSLESQALSGQRICSYPCGSNLSAVSVLEESEDRASLAWKHKEHPIFKDNHSLFSSLSPWCAGVPKAPPRPT